MFLIITVYPRYSFNCICEIGTKRVVRMNFGIFMKLMRIPPSRQRVQKLTKLTRYNSKEEETLAPTFPLARGSRGQLCTFPNSSTIPILYISGSFAFDLFILAFSSTFLIHALAPLSARFGVQSMNYCAVLAAGSIPYLNYKVGWFGSEPIYCAALPSWILFGKERKWNGSCTRQLLIRVANFPSFLPGVGD